MSTSIPKTMRAVVQQEKEKWIEVKEVDVPELEDNEVLIKVDYAAQNPTDWKHAVAQSVPGVINGNDYAGTVVKLGPNLKVPLKVGDKVAGTTHGGIYKDRGAFAEYAKISSDLCFKIPEGMKPEEAATYGIAWVTACQAILASQGHAFPPEKVPEGSWYIVYGASSSVGLFAVPLAKSLGYKVLAVCSPHSFDLVKSYGADEVVDYHDKDAAVAKAKKITGGGVEKAFDTISEGESWKITAAMMGEKGKRLNIILMPPSEEERKKYAPGIEIEWTLMYTLHGREFNFTPRKPEPMIIPAKPEDAAFGAKVYERTPEFYTKYNVKPNPVDLREEGLDGVSDGFKHMKEGKVSGKKLVYKI
ncbi:enoyl reductase [Kwoniella heveanensis CBS 569]|uniref:Enoyl reductase n=1 Tax=Kwoniella heveanensis BCC8398 TaxID=1296120 RepID=A0A1B9GZT8_9TREE|nr:enoyl reductase [Kwoniella heveanensis BCC8398]OCF45470.1 enoyl reductase [Kwoniella heveanensis CBS 569]